MDAQTHRPHRPSQSGAKAEKKKGKGKEKQKGNNVKVSGFVTHVATLDIFRHKGIRTKIRPES